MLTNGPLVGEAEVDSVEHGVRTVIGALYEALGGKYGEQHDLAMRKLAAALRAGERSWMSAGVWVTLED